MRLQGILAFLIIYIVWGSTFLAIRYAVETIPPFLTAATRHLIAGAILLAWAWRNGERPSKEAWRAGLVLGFLFFLVGHGTSLGRTKDPFRSGRAGDRHRTDLRGADAA